VTETGLLVLTFGAPAVFVDASYPAEEQELRDIHMDSGVLGRNLETKLKIGWEKYSW